MQVETIKAGGTYLAALILIVGGLWVIYATRSETAASEIRIVIAGFVGMALQFLFGAEAATRATRASESSVRTGASVSGTTPTITASPGPPATVTVSEGKP